MRSHLQNPPFWIARKPEVWNSTFTGAMERPVGNATMAGKEPTDVDRAISLSFKVSPEFKKSFKGFAVAHDISMTDLLKEGFTLSKKKRQK